MKTSTRILVSGLLAAMAWPALAAQRFCVFDFLGTTGDAYSMSKDLSLIHI